MAQDLERRVEKLEEEVSTLRMYNDKLIAAIWTLYNNRHSGPLDDYERELEHTLKQD